MKNLDNNTISKHLNTISNLFESVKESIPKHDEISIDDILQQCKIDIQEVITEPPVCLEVVSNSESSIIATLGNFSAVIGKAKSKKTFLITMAIATVIRNDSILNKFKGTLSAKQPLALLFDTEQSRYHVQKVVRRICELAVIPAPENFYCYGLRPYTPDKRIEIIDYAIQTIEGIGFIVIDGIRDLVRDINSPEEATAVVTRLMKWSEEKNIHIVTVIHQNKGDLNARGHLGTELINKAESVLSVTRDAQDSAISIVEAEYCREKDFPPFAFKIDQKGLPYILEDWQPSKEGKKSISPFDIPTETHSRILREIFQRSQNPTYKDLWQEVKYTFQQLGISFGDSKAKEFVTYYTNQKMIEKIKREEDKYSTYKQK
jgi:hypothetical protein